MCPAAPQCSMQGFLPFMAGFSALFTAIWLVFGDAFFHYGDVRVNPSGGVVSRCMHAHLCAAVDVRSLSSARARALCVRMCVCASVHSCKSVCVHVCMHELFVCMSVYVHALCVHVCDCVCVIVCALMRMFARGGGGERGMKACARLDVHECTYQHKFSAVERTRAHAGAVPATTPDVLGP